MIFAGLDPATWDQPAIIIDAAIFWVLPALKDVPIFGEDENTYDIALNGAHTERIEKVCRNRSRKSKSL